MKFGKLLRTEKDFLNWDAKNTLDGDVTKIPESFPCYADKRMLDWEYSSMEAIYCYKEDVEEMINLINAITTD